jgi:hypothetical protein
MTPAMRVCAALGVAAVVEYLGRLARVGNRRGRRAAAIPRAPALVPRARIGLPGGGS